MLCADSSLVSSEILRRIARAPAVVLRPAVLLISPSLSLSVSLPPFSSSCSAVMLHDTPNCVSREELC